MARSKPAPPTAASNGPTEDAQVAVARLEAEVRALRERAEETERAQAALLTENRRLRAERDQAVSTVAQGEDRERTTAGLLRLLGTVRGDPQPVFDAVAEAAGRLCGGTSARFFVSPDGRVIGPEADFVFAAVWSREHGIQPQGAMSGRRRWNMAEVAGRHPTVEALASRRTIYIPDVRELPPVPWSHPVWRAAVERHGAESHLSVPLLLEDGVLGGMEVWAPPHGLTPSLIRLVESFATQAVIAIENARLFSQIQDSNATLEEALEQQTATAEVLRVIASGPANALQAMGTILDCAGRLCNVADGSIWLVEGGQIALITRFRAGQFEPEAATASSVPRWQPLTHQQLPAVVARMGTILHVPDLEAVPETELPAPAVRKMGWRSLLAVPMLREGACVGVIMLYRTAPQPFTPAQLAVVETFAAQAAIAIDNGRLFTQLQEENARKERELERARAVQQRLLPSTVPAWLGKLEVAYRFRAAVETSGDFYDVVETAPTAPGEPAPLQIAVADTAGKGMGAALVMSLARAGLRYAATSPAALSPAGTARMVSDRLHRDVGSGSFVACALATVEPEGDRPYPRLRLVNAGQVPVLLCRAGRVEELEPPGARFPLGAIAGCFYQERGEQLLPGDVLILCTDGLPEAPARTSAKGQAPDVVSLHLPAPATPGELFGFERLAQSAAHWSAAAESAEAVAEGIWGDVTAWAGEESHHDDMTLLVLRVPA